MNGTPAPILENQPRTSALSIWSLVLGILGLVLLIACIGALLAIPAVICGHLARSHIKHSGGTLAGGGLALGGMITGYISLALGLMLAAIAVPNFVKARDIAMKNVCLRNLRQIDSAKRAWALEHQKDDSAIPTVAELEGALNGVVIADLKCPKHGNYSINAVNEEAACSFPDHNFSPAESP